MSDTMQPQPPETPGITEQEKTMGMVAHLLGIVYWLGPLIFWLVKKDESAYVKEQTLESLNFQITVLIAFVASGVLSAINGGLGALVWSLVALGNLVMVIMAVVASKEGVQYKYPVNLRLMK